MKSTQTGSPRSFEMELITQTDCIFSDPVDYQGNAPTTDLTSFQFRLSTCTQIATSSGDIPLTATMASTIEIGSNSAVALHDATYVVWIGFVTLLVAVGVWTALNFMGRSR